MNRFKGVDFYNTDSLLSEEELQVRDVVRDWVEDNVIPIIEKACHEETFPNHLIQAMGEMGLLGVNLSGYGCPGLSNVAYGLVCQELERGDSGLRSFVSVQSSLCMYPIFRFGNEEQRNKYEYYEKN
jgi:glutaryl-CoA dehydrogenase